MRLASPSARRSPRQPRQASPGTACIASCYWSSMPQKRRHPSLHWLVADVPSSISIVIPTLNAGRAFGTVLHRIMGQGRTPLEILCADSGSTDGTRHIVSQFALARFVEIAEPTGPRSWNRAMEEARGDVVVFLNQDVLPGNGDWLSHLTAPFDDPSVGGVYGRQEVAFGGDPLSGFRLAQRYCREPHRRRLDRMSPQFRGRFAPETAAEARRPDLDDLAA